MKHPVKKSLGVLMILVLAISLAACGGSKKSTESMAPASEAPTTAAEATPVPTEVPKDIKTLSILMFTEWDTLGWKALEKYINDNSAEVGFKIETEKIVGGSQGEQILKTKLATKDLPDLMQIYSPKYIDQNANALDRLVDLSGLASFKEYDEKAMEGLYHYKGKYYAAPIDTTTLLGVFYNKKIFNDLKLEVPITWEEFLAVCEKIKAAGKTAVYYAGKDAWTLQNMPHAGFTQDIADSGKSFPDFFEEINTNKAHYADQKGFIDVIKKSKELIDKGYVNKTYLSDTYDAAQKAVVDGAAAMHINGSWIMGEIEKKFPDQVNDIGAFPIPVTSESSKNYVNIFPPRSLAVTTSAKDVDLAKKAVDFIASAKAQQIYADAQPGIYLNKNVKTKLSPAIDDLAKVMVAGKGIPHWQGNGELYSYGAFDRFMQDYYVGGKTAEQVAQALDAETAKNAKAKNDPNWK